MKEELAARLETLKADGLLRAPLSIEQVAGPLLTVGGREVINLSSNDYLGLSGHQAVKAAASRAARQWGAGSGAARLVTGSLELHAQLERTLAGLLKTERALLMGSGYLANLGTIQALVSTGDLIYSDQLNHASIVDACRLSRAHVRVFKHRDVDHLTSLLEEDALGGGRRLVVTETVFSMDGDEAPLGAICQVAQKHGAWVMADEAHAFGVLGPAGAGLVARERLEDQVLVRMGTLGKAAGSYGAFLAGSTELVEFLINSSRSFIYSTSLPPPVVAAALAAVEIISGTEGDRLRGELSRAALTLRGGLIGRGYELGNESGPIVPLLVGDPMVAVGMAELLLERGVVVRAMRYPTVPWGSERLRLVACAAHSPQQLERALSAFTEANLEVVR